MQTQILYPDHSSYSLASSLIRQGKLVAFPTETVYGLGADALQEKAVLSIFSAKGRPADNPLIVHIHHRSQLESVCEIPDAAFSLMDAFWPGPLTMLFPKKPSVPDVVTAGLPTVAVRMPSHPVALAFLQACATPVAAPSANRSGRPSPTTAAHVLEDMAGKIPLILDGGACDVGVESTVLDLVHGQPCILRPGGVTREMLESVLQEEVLLAGSILRPLAKNEVALSPGMRYKHYAPKAEVTLISGKEQNVLQALKSFWQQSTDAGHRTCVLCFSEHLQELSDCNPHDLGSLSDASQVAHRLFDLLRGLDEEGIETVYSEVISTDGLGLAVMNRLGRAAAFRTIEV